MQGVQGWEDMPPDPDGEDGGYFNLGANESIWLGGDLFEEDDSVWIDINSFIWDEDGILQGDRRSDMMCIFKPRWRIQSNHMFHDMQ